MVRISFCPSCGAELKGESFICPNCSMDVEEFFSKGYLLMGEENENSMELLKDEEFAEPTIEIVEDGLLDGHNIDVKPGDEIVIVVPESEDDEIVIDLDELGIDVESLGDEVNIVIQVDGDLEESPELFDDDNIEPNQWFFDDDPYDIVYYEFVDDEDLYD